MENQFSESTNNVKSGGFLSYFMYTKHRTGLDIHEQKNKLKNFKVFTENLSSKFWQFIVDLKRSRKPRLHTQIHMHTHKFIYTHKHKHKPQNYKQLMISLYFSLLLLNSNNVHQTNMLSLNINLKCNAQDWVKLNNSNIM